MMDELRQMFTVSYEYAREKRDAIEGKYEPMVFWSNDDTADHAYWEGQGDAFQRAVDMLNTQLFAEQTAKAKRWLSGEES